MLRASRMRRAWGGTEGCGMRKVRVSTQKGGKSQLTYSTRIKTELVVVVVVACAADFPIHRGRRGCGVR